MSSPVVILGAGLGGLTLGRCLRQKGISSIIYDRASSTPRHTYGITLQPWAYRPLLDILELDESTFRQRLTVDNGAGRVSAADATTSTPFRVNRSKLESMLREGLDIHFEYSLSSAKPSGSGNKADLMFENGEHLSPDLVVDATGVHSKLRKALLPSISPEVQPFAVYSGKRYVNSDTFSSVYAPAFKDGNVIVREPQKRSDPRLEISVNSHQEDGRVSISYIFSRGATNDGGIDHLHNPDRPQTDATKIPEEFYQEVDQFLQRQKPGTPFEECFSVGQLRSDRVLHWLMRTVLVSKEDLLKLRQQGVVMIGDSAHALPILGADGANMAILDAIKLAEFLEKDRTVAHIENFYQSTWDDWSAAVEASKKSLAEMHRVEASTANL